MSQNRESFNRVVMLTAARIFGIIFSFVIPMYLGRHLEVETYGTYKQVMVIYWFAQVALNLGFDDSVFYFIRWDKKNFPLYSLNSLLFNLTVTGALAAGMTFFRTEIATLLNNPDLAQYLPLLGYLIVATICSLQIEGFLLNLNRFRARLWLDAGTELLKAVAILGAFLIFDSIMVALALLAALMTLRLLWSVGIMHSHKMKEGLLYRDSLQFFKKQAKFGLPLGFSRIIQNILNMENMFISYFYNITQFTYYSVGCFENPLINSLRTSLYEVVNIDLIDQIRHGNHAGAADVWRRMTRKLFLVVIPFTVYMSFFAKELIVLIFSDKYLASVPYFMVFNFYIFIVSLNPEPLFRSTSNTGYAFKIKVFGVLLGIAMILAGAHWVGPMAVLWGKILAVSFINISGLIIGARFLHTNVLHLFNWKDLGKTLVLSVVLSIVLRGLFRDLSWHPFWILAASFSLYFVAMFFAACKVRLLKADEVSYIFSKLKLGLSKLNGLAKKEVIRG